MAVIINTYKLTKFVILIRTTFVPNSYLIVLDNTNCHLKAVPGVFYGSFSTKNTVNCALTGMDCIFKCNCIVWLRNIVKEKKIFLNFKFRSSLGPLFTPNQGLNWKT